LSKNFFKGDQMLVINVDFSPTPIAAFAVEHVAICHRSTPIGDSISSYLPLASFIRVLPADGGGNIPYNELVCSEKDQENIAFIITTMAENGKLTLLFRKGELNRIGAEINHVHPFKFLGTVFANDELKAHMREIYKDYFKWNGFMDGLGPSLTNKADQDKLGQYLEEFATEARVPAQELTGYINSKDWESMVRYLMTH
jgi:hypothetical protein